LLLIIVLNTLPLVLFGVSWWQYRKERLALPGWRNILFVIALAANALSGAVLLSFVVHGRLILSGVAPRIDLDLTYPGLTMLGVGLVSIIFAGFGRRLARLLLMLDGLLVALLWYFAGMAASP
jgi:hypothetical protein